MPQHVEESRCAYVACLYEMSDRFAVSVSPITSGAGALGETRTCFSEM